MEYIYLDNSATTPLCKEAIVKMQVVMESVYGNPSSLHTLGLEAEKVVSTARKEILSALGASGKNLIFCGSGTEANNLAVFGTAYAKKNPRSKRIITTDSEHPSILEPMKKLEQEGFMVIRISTKNGVLNQTQLEEALQEPPLMVSVMLVNNETGAVNPIKRVSALAKKANPDCVVHCDAVQGFLKVPFTPDQLGVDLLTISSHKIHAPKGVGALYVHPSILKAKKLVPYILGGGQENGMRSGTENVIGIAGFGVAATIGTQRFEVDTEQMRSVREFLIAHLPEKVSINLPQSEQIAPHIVNIILPSIKSETMLHFLAKKGIYVSSGSACASHSRHASHVLTAFGLSEWQADCCLRISLNPSITEEQISRFLSALEQGIQSLIRIK